MDRKGGGKRTEKQYTFWRHKVRIFNFHLSYTVHTLRFGRSEYNMRYVGDRKRLDVHAMVLGKNYYSEDTEVLCFIH